MPNVLITGGAGFIGSNLCKKLIQKQFNVYCLDNLLTGDEKNLQTLSKNPAFKMIRHDITKPLDNLKTDFDKPDYIFHLASPASPNPDSDKSYISLPIETLLANSQGTHNMLALAKETKAKFLFASTSEIYGDPKISPQPETYFGNVNPVGVRSVYDEAKRFGEALVFAYIRKYNVNARIIRIFNTYGPNMRKDDGRVISNFINQALTNAPITIHGTGTQTRSFCYIDDLIAGIEKAMFTSGTESQVINLGNPDERTINEIAGIIIKLTNSSSPKTNQPRPQDDPETRKPDITKARAILNWQPAISLDDGLKKTIQYFKNV